MAGPRSSASSAEPGGEAKADVEVETWSERQQDLVRPNRASVSETDWLLGLATDTMVRNLRMEGID